MSERNKCGICHEADLKALIPVCDPCVTRVSVCVDACRSIPTSALEAGVVEMMVEYFKLIKQLHEFCLNHNFDNDKHLNENCDKLDGLNGRIRDAKQEIMKLLEESK
jgi:hypothetical protein